MKANYSFLYSCVFNNIQAKSLYLVWVQVVTNEYDADGQTLLTSPVLMMPMRGSRRMGSKEVTWAEMQKNGKNITNAEATVKNVTII